MADIASSNASFARDEDSQVELKNTIGSGRVVY